MFERIATILGILAVLAAVGFYVYPRYLAGDSPAPSGERGARLDAARVLAARAAAERPAAAPRLPEGPDGAALLALQRVNDENLPERLERVRAEIEKHGETAVRLGALGWLLVMGSEPDAADEHITRALALDPGCAVANVARAHLHMRHGRFAKAEEPLRRAVAGSPRVAEWHRLLAVVQLAQNRTGRALRAAERSVLLDPDDRYGYLAVGDVYLREARFAEAVSWYEAAIELAGGPDSELAARHEPVLSALRERAAKP